MLFAWQGFQLEHPTDWAPLTLSGTRKEGYVRISGPERGFLQLRWQCGKSPVSEHAVQTYLKKLERDAKHGKAKFSSKLTVHESRVNYSYSGSVSAKGALLTLDSPNDVIFLEAVDSAESVFRTAERSFLRPHGPLERWALHGLNIQLPSSLTLDAHQLKAGKTNLQLSGAKMRVVAERWGFGEQLLASRTLSDWTSALAALPSPLVEEGENRVSLSQTRKLLPSIFVKSTFQPDLNQITVLRVETRMPSLEPQWNWFD